jgi:predicted DNA-binding transcriptional regulator YafY
MPRGDQLSRQWQLVRLLSGRQGRTLAQLKSELGVTKRTVQRDIAVLERAGFPVVTEERNGSIFWHFVEGFHVESPLALTLTELMALYFSKGLLRPLQGSAMHESLESAMQKIGASLPAPTFHLLRALESAVSVRSLGWKDYSRCRGVVDSLTRAIFHRLTVRLEHAAAGYRRTVEHTVDPYRLWYVNNGLYLVGQDHRKDALRVFAIERIRSAAPTNRHFQVPPDFDFNKFTETAFQMIWGEPQLVRVHFSADQSPYITERTWHPSQAIEKRRGGSTILSLRVADLGEVKRWLIGFGAEAQVLEPKQLRDEIAQECAHLLQSAKHRSAGDAREESWKR